MSRISFKISISDALVLNVDRGLYRLEDISGKIITRIPYSYISTPFSIDCKELLLCEDVDGLFGALNVKGEEVVEPIYDELKVSEEGNRLVGLRNNEWEILEIA